MPQQVSANAHECTQAVVTDVPTCGAVSYAREHGIGVHVYPHRQGSDQDADAPLSSPGDLVAMLQREQVQLVLLAGYLKLVPAEVVAAFHRRMLNIHPGLLPAFGGKGMYGKRVHQSVISSGSRCAPLLYALRGPCAFCTAVQCDVVPGRTVLDKCRRVDCS